MTLQLLEQEQDKVISGRFVTTEPISAFHHSIKKGLAGPHITALISHWTFFLHCFHLVRSKAFCFCRQCFSDTTSASVWKCVLAIKMLTLVHTTSFERVIFNT